MNRNKHWEKFLKTGDVKDYLKYKEEFAKEKMGEVNDSKGNNPKNNKIQGNK